jgi:hypothetical protein
MVFVIILKDTNFLFGCLAFSEALSVGESAFQYCGHGSPLAPLINLRYSLLAS